MKKILITGGAGYIGSMLAKKLIAEEHKVSIIDNLSYGKESNIPKEVTFHQVDILSPELETVIAKEQPDIIFHLAASKSVNESLEKPLEFARTNILGSMNVVNAALKAGVKRLVFTSTAGVYGDYFTNGKQEEDQRLYPSSPYGWTKLTIEDYIQYVNEHNKTEYITLRFANVYGPGGISYYKSAIDTFVENAIYDKPILIHGNGNQTRDFIFISDLVNLCCKLKDVDLSECKERLLFNVSTSTETTVNDVIKIIAEITKKPLDISYDPSTFAGQERSILSNEKAKKILSWKPSISLAEGIKRIVSTYEI